MKPAPFRYLLAHSIAHALELKAQHGGEAAFLAGGQSLVPAMNFRLAQPAVLIDLNEVIALAGIRPGPDGAIAIGALTRNAAVERDAALARHQPLVTEAMAQVAHPQIRNRGTLGGNLAHADPASEMPAVILALGATLIVQSTRGERQIAARDFFHSVFTTALEPDEALIEIRLPALARGTGTAFLEVARRAGDYAMMGVAARVTLDADGRCTDARLAYCGAGETPRLATHAAQALIGERIDVTTATAAGAAARGEIDPMGNVHATVAYQKHLAGVLTRRALIAAAGRVRL